jgi:hypothetical protein
MCSAGWGKKHEIGNGLIDWAHMRGGNDHSRSPDYSQIGLFAQSQSNARRAWSVLQRLRPDTRRSFNIRQFLLFPQHSLLRSSDVS